MADDPTVKLESYKDKCKKEGEVLVKDVFPRKVLELNDLLESSQFAMDRMTTVEPDLNIPVPDPILFNNSSDAKGKKRKLESLGNDLDYPSGTKVMALPNGPVPTSTTITEMVDVVKPKIRDVIDHANKIKMWIAYSIPRIEDGNNFGVGIQEDTLAEARQVETEAATFLDQISRYYLTRAKIVAKVAKYPHVMDFRRSIKEVDEKQALTLRLLVSELRNQYASLHDMIIKNLDKIKKPRSVNQVNMY